MKALTQASSCSYPLTLRPGSGRRLTFLRWCHIYLLTPFFRGRGDILDFFVRTEGGLFGLVNPNQSPLSSGEVTVLAYGKKVERCFQFSGLSQAGEKLCRLLEPFERIEVAIERLALVRGH